MHRILCSREFKFGKNAMKRPNKSSKEIGNNDSAAKGITTMTTTSV